jgi:predicted transcriptional regulator
MKDQPAEKKIGGITGKGFLPGTSGNPGGMKPGTKHTFNRIKEIFAHCFNEKAFQVWAKNHQKDYLELLVRIMPKGLEIDTQVTGTVKKTNPSEELEEFTKEELKKILSAEYPEQVIKGISTEELIKIIQQLPNRKEIREALITENH